MDTRKHICKVLLDFMRRELAIKVDYLKPDYQDQIKQLSSQHLIAPWVIDDKEQLEHASILFPRSSRPNDYGGNTYLSARGGFSKFLKSSKTLPDYQGSRKVDDIAAIIQHLIDVLCIAGLVEKVAEAAGPEDANGYSPPPAWSGQSVTAPCRSTIRSGSSTPRTPVGARTHSL